MLRINKNYLKKKEKKNKQTNKNSTELTNDQIKTHLNSFKQKPETHKNQ
jgi:hypothetical protein